MSDHSPVSLILSFQHPSAERRGCRIPDRLLSSTDLSDRIAHIWDVEFSSLDLAEHSHAEFLATCIRESSSVCREYTSASRLATVRRERSLLAPLASVQRLLQSHPGDAHYAARQSELLTELREVQERRSEFYSHTTAAHWVALGDRILCRSQGETPWDLPPWHVQF